MSNVIVIWISNQNETSDGVQVIMNSETSIKNYEKTQQEENAEYYPELGLGLQEVETTKTPTQDQKNYEIS